MCQLSPLNPCDQHPSYAAYDINTSHSPAFVSIIVETLGATERLLARTLGLGWLGLKSVLVSRVVFAGVAVRGSLFGWSG
jgi:hypothetical protein